MPCGKLCERCSQRKLSLPAESKNGFGWITEGSGAHIKRSEFPGLNVAVTRGCRLNAIGNQNKAKPSDHLRHEAVNHFIRQVLQHVFDDQQIGGGHIVEVVRCQLESYVLASIYSSVIFYHGLSDIEAEVFNAGPVHPPRNLPITAPEINDSFDAVFAYKVLHEPPIAFCHLRQRAVTGAKAPKIVTVDLVKYGGDSRHLGMITVAWHLHVP
jgi:hypothetical protein